MKISPRISELPFLELSGLSYIPLSLIYLDDIGGEDAVDILGPVWDQILGNVAHLRQLHGVVELGGVPPLFPGQRRVGQLDLEGQRLLQLLGGGGGVSAQHHGNLEMHE